MTTNSPLTNTIGPIISSVTVPNGGYGVGAGPYTINVSGGANATISTPTWTNNNSTNTLTAGQLSLNGVQADIVINGVSLMSTLKLLQERLNILRPNPAIEAEWDQLRELGEQYRKLEAELLEKQRAWEILKRSEG